MAQPEDPAPRDPDPTAAHPVGATAPDPVPAVEDRPEHWPPTYLRGRRTGWTEAPAAVRARVQEVLGEPVAGWQDRVGGMSVGLAVVVRGARRAVFVKALDGTQNPAGHEMYRREAESAGRLPRSPSIARLLSGTEVAAPSGSWVVNVFEAVPGDPPRHPWRRADLRRVLDAWADLTPALHATTWDVAAGFPTFLGRWRTVQEDPDDPWHRLLAPWADRLERVVADADGSPEHPPVLSHADLRADNLLLAPDTGSPGEPGVWFVDWAQPALAAPWADPAVLFADVLASGADLADGGGIDVEGLWRTHPATAAFDVGLVRTMVVAVAAALHVGARRPPSPLFPHQRGWERTMADRLVPYATRHAG